MLLGLHTYSFHLHGMGQNWGGFKLGWVPAWDVFGLMGQALKLGLDGLHLTAVDMGSTEDHHLARVKAEAQKRGFSWNTIFPWMPLIMTPGLPTPLSRASA